MCIVTNRLHSLLVWRHRRRRRLAKYVCSQRNGRLWSTCVGALFFFSHTHLFRSLTLKFCSVTIRSSCHLMGEGARAHVDMHIHIPTTITSVEFKQNGYIWPSPWNHTETTIVNTLHSARLNVRVFLFTLDYTHSSFEECLCSLRRCRLSSFVRLLSRVLLSKLISHWTTLTWKCDVCSVFGVCRGYSFVCNYILMCLLAHTYIQRLVAHESHTALANSSLGVNYGEFVLVVMATN